MCDLPPEGFALICDNAAYYTVPLDGSEVMECTTFQNGLAFTPDCEASAYDPETGLYYVFQGSDLYAIDTNLPCGSNNVSLVTTNAIAGMPVAATFGISNGMPVLYVLNDGIPAVLTEIDPTTGNVISTLDLVATFFSVGTFTSIAFDPVSGLLFGINPALDIIFRIDMPSGDVIPCIQSINPFAPNDLQTNALSIGPDGTFYIEGDLDDMPPTRAIYSFQVPPILDINTDCFVGNSTEPVPVATYMNVTGELNTLAFNGTACSQQCDLLMCEITNVIDALCVDSEDGSATVTALNGTAPFIYIWDNGETTQTATMLLPGPHTVTVTDAFMCELICDVEIGEPTNPVQCIIAESQSILCNGEATGALTVSVNGGTAPFDILWFNNLTTPTITGLAAGTYDVEITDANGCTTSCDFILTEPPALICEDVIIESDVTCFGFNDGSATAVVSGGTPPFTYLWPSGETTVTATLLQGGVNNVTVTDANGCENICLAVIGEPDELTCSTILIQDTECADDIDGSAEAVPTGGTAPYTFLWSNGETTAIATMLGPGEQFVTVTDSNGCETVCSVVISEISFLVCMTELIQNVSCNGDSDGSATVTVTGALLPISIEWSNGETAATAVNLPAGLSTVTITDANTCTIVCDISISEPPLLTCGIIITSEILCFGDSNGEATATPMGGTAPFTYLWDDGQTTQTAIGLDAGISMVTVTDMNGCTTVCQAELTTPPELICNVTLENNVRCNGFNDGSATAIPTGGTSPFTYEWSNGELTQTALFLSATTEFVTVTDANQCEVVCSIEITEPIELQCNVMLINDVLCQGESNGSAEVIPVGGTPPFTSFLWDNGETTQIATMLNAGFHTVTVLDANMCEAFCNITIGDQSELACSVVLESSILCGGDLSGAVSADVTGGVMPFSFLWSNGEVTQTIMNLGPDTYTVTVTDANGCTTECELTVTEPPILTCSIEVVQEIVCFGDQNGSATVTPDGGTPGFTFLWDNGETTATAINLSGGSHTVIVTDSNGCTTECDIVIPSPDELICTVTLISPITCFGEVDASATVEITGGTPGFSLEWSNGETTSIATMLPPGLNTVTVTDMNGCTTTCSIDIIEPLELTCEITQVSDVVCAGESNASATISTTNGVEPFTFLWDNGETTVTAVMLSAGLREATVTDANGCNTVCSILIEDREPLICDITLVNNVTCSLGADGSATVMAAGGLAPYTFEWSNGEVGMLAVQLQAGVNIVTVTDTNDCVSTCEILITEPPLFECNTTLLNGVDCFGDTNGSATVSATGGNGGFTFLWDNGETTPIATMLPAGQRFVTVSDSENCEIVCDIIIPSPEELVCDISLENNISCFGANDGSATVSVEGGTPDFNFEWSNGETASTATMLVPGLNVVTVTDINGCQTTCEISIAEPLEFTCEVTLVSDVLCAGDANGIATVAPTNGIAPFTYLWDNGETTATAVMLAGGGHTVTVTDATNCTTVCDIEIMDQSTLDCTVVLVNNVSCFGFTDGSATAIATGGNPPFNYTWDNGETTQTAVMLDAGLHTVTVNDINNCGSTCTIEILEPPLLECTITLGNDISCFGFNDGTATVAATGGTPEYMFLWDDGQTTETAIGLLPGTRTVTVTDANGCESTCEIVIAEPTQLSCTVTLINDISCFGANDGSASVEVLGGTPGFTFLWDDGQTTSTVVGLTPGPQSVTVTDANGCMTTCGITIQEPLEFICDIELVNDVLCAGDTNGSATAVTTNGIAPFTYLWDNGETTETAVMLAPGAHTVTVTDATNCISVCDIQIMDQILLECTVVLVNNVSCFGFTDGSATAIPSGGNLPFNYTWDNGETTQTATMLDAGLHTVTVNDINNCETICTIEITEPPALECSISLENDVSCFGFNDGSATVTATGGTPEYTFLWDDGQTTETAVGLEPGIRAVTVTDSNGCLTVCDITIVEPPELVCTITLVNDVTCFGADDGSAMVVPTGGIPGYTFLWDDGQITATVVGLTPGLQTVTVTDTNGCTTTCSITIQEPLEFTCDVTLVSDVLCAGDVNGSATAVATNGIAPFTFLWDNGETTATAVMLSGGGHTVTVTDATNCTTVCDIEIMDQSTLDCTIVLVNNVSCFGFSDGSATAMATGGNPPFSYMWDNGETTQTATMLDAGLHTVTVNDINDCGTTCTIEIAEPPILQCSIVLENDISCFGFNDGSATVTATGGTPEYTFLWDDGQTTETAIGLLPGTRTVTVTDANGCETVCDINIMEPTELVCSITLENDISCFGANDGSATVNPTGGVPGYTFLWDDGQITATAVGLTPGPHTATVTDANGCTTVCAITIQEPLEFTCTVELVNDVLCAGDTNGSATAIPSNGIAPFTFLWDNGEVTATAVILSGGGHTVTITDATNCTTVCDIEILDQSTLDCTIVLVNNVSCFGFADGSATAMATGGNPPFSYTWDNGETTQTAIMLDAGLHTVTVNDINNCGTTCTIEITEPPVLECEVTLENDISCFGFNDGSATVTPSGGTPDYAILWDDGQITLTAVGLTPGLHLVTVTDANGCETVCDITIIEPTELVCTISLENDVSCFGANDGSATVTPTGGVPQYTFLWDDGQVTATAVGLTPGPHTATVTDANGCTTVCAITIQEPLEFTCTVELVNDVLCAGDTNGSATAIPSNGVAPFTFLWDNGEVTATAVILSGGGHTVTITDATNCTTVCDIEIMDQSTLDCTIDLVNNVSCFGFTDGSATATATGGNPPFNYMWDNGETTQTATMLDAGLHTVTVNDLNNCGTTCTIEITQPPLLECEVTLENDVSCFGFNDGSATVTPSGGTPDYAILWDDGQTTLTAAGLTPGLHLVTVTDANGCETVCDITIAEPPELVCTITLVNDITCFGADDGSAMVVPTGGVPGYTFLWDDGQITATVVGLTPGLQSVTVTDMNGCTTTCSITIQEPLELTCDVALVSDVLCAGDVNGSATAVPTNGVAPFTYLWDNGETTATAVMLSGGGHTVTVTDATNCMTVCDIEIMDQSTLDCTIDLVNNVSCFGFTDGSATATATGGNPPFSYMWDNGETTQTATMLDAGLHTVTVNDLNNCGTTCTIEITQPPLLECEVTLENDVSCFGFNDGSATVTATGGVPGYTFLWDDGQTTLTAINLLPGTRTVTVTDANGCESTCDILIAEPPELVCTISVINDISCFGANDGAATANPTGGVPDFTFLWDDGQVTQTAVDLTPGLHTVTVTDMNDCTTVCDVTIQEPLEFTCVVQLVNNVLCAGDTNGSALAVPENGIAPFTFLWDNGETSALAVMLSGGGHTVTITDATNCTTFCDIEIMDQSTLDCFVVLEENVTCFGFSDGSATAMASGGNPPFNYLWDNGETTQTAIMLTAGLHTVTVNDLNNCGTTCTIEITEPPILVCSIELENDVTCFGFNDGSATVSATGGVPGYTFLWDDGQTTLTAVGLEPGIRTVTVTDANGCESTCEISIVEPPELTCSITLVNDVNCFGADDGSATAVPIGGRPDYTFLWDDGQTTQTAVGLTPGLHSVTVTDESLCTTTCEITILEPLEFSCSIELLNNVLCAGDTNGSATAIPSNGIAPFTFLWDNGETTATAVMLTGGINTVTITDSNNCMTICDIFIQDQSGLTCEIDVVSDISCFGFDDGSATGNPDGGVPPYTYLWDNGETTQTAVALNPGLHELTVTDSNDCGTICLVEIEEPTIVSIALPIPTVTTTCSGNDDGSANVTPAGGTPGYTFLWSNGETTQEAIALPEGQASVTVTDANGCFLVETFIINPPEFPIVEIINVTDVSCERFFDGTENDGSATAVATGGNPGFTFLWSNGETTPTAVNLMPGLNSVTVTDQFGCQTIETVEIELDNCFSIDLVKLGSLVNPDDVVVVGSQIEYAFEVCNNGTVALNIVTVDDPLVTITGGPVNLLPGQCDEDSFTGLYTVTQADLDNQFVSNQATAQGFDVINNNPVISASDDPFTGAVDDATIIVLQQPSISLEKTADVSGVQSPPQPGDEIAYVFTICNTGDLVLSSVTVTDPIIDLIGAPIPTLEPGVCNDVAFSGVHVITAADIAIGFVENTAQVTSFDTNNNIIEDQSDDPSDLQNVDPNGDGNPDDPTIVLLEAAPQVELFKRADVSSDCPTVGDLVIYTFEICNTGNIDLQNLAVSDNLATVLGSPVSLTPGECNSTSYLASYSLTQADIDNGVVVNSAMVNGFDANNNPLSDISDDPDQLSDIDSEGDGEADDPTLTFLLQKATIEIEKVGVFNDESGDGIAQVGETVSYSFTVRNTGNVTLSNVVVTDPLVTVSGGPIPSMGPGVEDAVTFTGDYTLQVPDIEIAMVENMATIAGLDPIGQTVTNASTELVEYIVRACDEIICNANLRISLGPSCELQLNEDHLIEDPVFGLYTISLFDGDSFINDTGLLTSESVGRTLNYQVSCGQNSCWGRITVEGNSLPVFDTPCMIGPNGEVNPECTFLCNEFGIPLDLITVEELEEIFASPCTPDLFGQIIVTETQEGDECVAGGTIVTITYSAKLRINSRILDEQEILTQAYIISPHALEDVIFPFDVTVDCSFNTSPEALAGAFQNSRFGFPTVFDENFVPEGDSILVCDPGGLEEIVVGTREEMQLEIIDGEEVWTLVTVVEKQTIVVIDSSTCRLELDEESIAGLNFVPLEDRYCNLLSSFSDMEFESCGSGRKILRTWNVIDWCTASSSVSAVQTIEAVDNNPPQLTRFLSDVFVNIEPWTCTGTFVLPSLFPSRDFFEACSNVDVEFNSEEGIIVDGVITELWFTEDPIQVEVILTDECGNQTTNSFRIIMRDLTRPVMICNPGLQILLTGTEDNGSGTLFASDLDEGSHDAGCGPVDLQVIRVEDATNPIFNCNGDFLGFEPVTCGALISSVVLSASESGDDKLSECEDTVESLISMPGDFVKFCCQDVGRSIEVILIATDKQGNTNQCIVEVTVDENFIPQLSCPTVVTDCQSEEITLPDVVGSICAIEEFEPILITEIDEGTTCTNLNMVREWFIDLNGNGVVDAQDPFCAQLVTIDGDATTLDPFTIKWPVSFDGTTAEGINIECNDDGEPVESAIDVQMGAPMECIAESNLSEPVWCPTDCGLVGSSVELDTISSSEACFIIIRRWTIVDWCAFDANANNNDQDQDTYTAVQDWAQFECTGCFYSSAWDDTNYLRYDEVDRDGYYTYDQVIQVVDETGPEISAPIDYVVVVGSDEAVKTDSSECNGSGDIEVSATDSCNGEAIDSETITWRIIVQRDGEEIASKTATGSTVSMNTQEGRVGDVHTIIWIANDNCGNETTSITTVTFEDSVPPTPFCLTALTSNVPDSEGQVVVWANEFDFGSFDNCASDEELRFSIVPAGAEPIQPSEDEFVSQAQFTLNCEDQVTFIELDIWVWDRSDNGDFCTVSFMISEACGLEEDVDNLTIGGRVQTFSGLPIPQASVSLNANLSEFPKGLITDQDGGYAFTSNPIQENYNLSVSREGDDPEGLSTLDVLMIQRHIIGVQNFDNPYSIIASDANSDSRVTAVDIVSIRQLVLGQLVEFENSPSWVFIDESSSFFDELNPWPFSESINIEDFLVSGFDYNFTGVKVGDVNEDGPVYSAEIRTKEVDKLLISDTQFEYGADILVPVFGKDLKSLYGLQFTLEHQGLKLLDVIPGQLDIADEHYYSFDSSSTMSWNVTEDRILLSDDALFTLHFKSISEGNLSDIISITSAITNSELYETMDESSAVILDVLTDDFALFQNQPNPFNEETTITFNLPKQSMVTLSYYSAEGKLLTKSTNEYLKGRNQITVTKEELNHTGLIYYRVESEYGNEVKKMILLK